MASYHMLDCRRNFKKGYGGDECSMLGIEKSKACLQVVKSSLPPMLPSHPFPNWNELGSARIWLIFVLVDRESFKLHALTVSYQNLLSLICIIIV